MDIGISLSGQSPYLPARDDSAITGCLNVPMKSDRQGTPTNLDEILRMRWTNLPSPTAGIGESATPFRCPVQADEVPTLPESVQGILSQRLKYNGRVAARIAWSVTMDITYPS